MLWLGYIVLAVAGYLLIPKDLALKPNIGLECSWMISLNLALLRKAWYGTDYIYTYGPLGFLYTRVLLGQSKWLMVMTDAFVFGNLLYMLYYYLKQSGRYKIVAYTVVILTALLSQHIPCVLTLFIILLYHSAAICFNYRQIRSLLVAAVSAALLFFIKLNYGIIGLPIFYLALLIILIENGTRSVMPVLVAAALNIVIVILLSVSFRVHLFPYLVSGLYLIKDYNDAVATQADYSSFYLFGFAVILVLYFASSLLFFRKYKFKLNEYYLPASLMLSLFLAFKNGFVRSDDIHMTGAYLILPFLTMVPVVLSPYKLMRSWYTRLHVISLCFCLFFWRGPYNI